MPIFPVNRNTVLFLPDPHSKKDVGARGAIDLKKKVLIFFPFFFVDLSGGYRSRLATQC